VSHFIFQPGWRWSTDVGPIMKTPSCQLHHIGIVLSGHLHIVMDEGAEMRFGPGDAYEVPPGHDAWVEGDEACDVYEFTSGRVFGVPGRLSARWRTWGSPFGPGSIPARSSSAAATFVAWRCTWRRASWPWPSRGRSP